MKKNRSRLYYVGFSMRKVFNKFFYGETSCGILLLFFASAAIFCANNQNIAPYYTYFFSREAGFDIEGIFGLSMTIEEWINDGLMTIFFLVVGLEIKREMMVGQLSSLKKASLPLIAAAGGMIFPALIYLIFNHGTDTINGWGIPMATDIAFAIGILSILGKRVPIGLKVFLTALAIADDLGSIIVIAFFYPSHNIDFSFLLMAAGVTLFLVVMNRMRVNKSMVYLFPGILLWYLILKSGVHATISGVILAITVPARSTINEFDFSNKLSGMADYFRMVSNRECSVLTNPKQQLTIHAINVMTLKVNPMLHRFEEFLSPVSNYFIMPLFAFANAGVVFDASLFSLPIPPIVPGIFFGLLIGKPIGIFLSSWLAVKLKIAVLPNGSKWIQLLSIGVIAGIGFTMAIFVDGFAFLSSEMSPVQIENYINLGKATILITSIFAAIFGLTFLSVTTKKESRISK
jgi:Na+:H+ antiporter, NhaA family